MSDSEIADVYAMLRERLSILETDCERDSVQDLELTLLRLWTVVHAD